MPTTTFRGLTPDLDVTAAMNQMVTRSFGISLPAQRTLLPCKNTANCESRAATSCDRSRWWSPTSKESPSDKNSCRPADHTLVPLFRAPSPVCVRLNASKKAVQKLAAAASASPHSITCSPIASSLFYNIVVNQCRKPGLGKPNW